MSKPRLFLCNGKPADNPSLNDRHTVTLTAAGTDPNVHIRLQDVAKVFCEDLSPRAIDLLEIAAYVYTADASTRRDGAWADDHATEPWARDFHFVVGVRDLEFWNREDVRVCLCKLLSFLSDDKYAFDFVPVVRQVPAQTYLELGDLPAWPFKNVDRVVMFSGGLDSLAGAVEVAASDTALVLVSHRPVASSSMRQKALFDALQAKFSARMIHVPVWINKSQDLGREHTQRTRSFLYSALGAVVAQSVQAGGVRFFENGVVSLNLPVADEVLRARASRTTHPLALDRMQALYSLILERPFAIDNPYFFKTKTEVVEVLTQHHASELIQHTCSCAHTGYHQSRSQWHCGTCSQCIDRRIAVIAAGQAEKDPDTDYVSDVFVGERKDGYEQNIAVDYVRHATELDQMSEMQIGTRFSFDISRAARCFPRAAEAANGIISLHKRHGATVRTVLTQLLVREAGRMVTGALPPTSLLAKVAGNAHKKSSWVRYADKIASVLAAGIPPICRKRKPKDEPELQAICDGLLRGAGVTLRREFPFMAWSSGSTKPDWSAEELALWIELKYVRKTTGIAQIGTAIASDITKYGDNRRRTVYVVYDPRGLVVDRAEFARDIVKHDGMLVRFIP